MNCTHSLDSDEGETGVNERAHETEKVTSRSGNTSVVGEGARITPVLESDTFAVGCTSECNDNRYDNEAEEAENLDRGAHDFGFPIALNVSDVYPNLILVKAGPTIARS